jgi:hypothetical protein
LSAFAYVVGLTAEAGRPNLTGASLGGLLLLGIAVRVVTEASPGSAR